MFKSISHKKCLLISIFIVLIFTGFFFFLQKKYGQNISENTGGGSGTIEQLDQWKATTSPYSAITTNVHAKNVYIPYGSATSSLFAADTFCINNTTPDCITAWPTGSSNLSDYITYTAASSTPFTLSGGLIETASSTIVELHTDNLYASSTSNFTGLSVFSGGLTGTLTGSLVGNADTATALFANGGNCGAGNAPLGVDALGAVESCFDVWTEAENTTAAYISQSALQDYITWTSASSSLLTLNGGLIETASSTFSNGLIVNGDTLQASSTLLAGGTASSTFYSGLVVSAGGLALHADICADAANGGVLTTDSVGNIICEDDNDSGATDLTNYITYTAASSTLFTLNGGLIETASSTFNGELHTDTLYATSTSAFGGLSVFYSGINVNSQTITDFLGEGLTVSGTQQTFDCSAVTDTASDAIGCSGENLVVDVTGDWTGTLDTFNASQFLRSDADDEATGLLTFTGAFISSASSTVNGYLNVQNLHASSTSAFGGLASFYGGLMSFSSSTISLLHTDETYASTSAAFDGQLFIPRSTTLTFPVSANLTPIGVDTTQDQLIYGGAATTTIVLSATSSKSFVLFNAVDADNFNLWYQDSPIVVTAITCITDPADSGESVVIALFHSDTSGDFTSLAADGIDGATTMTCANTPTADDGALSSPGVAAGQWVGVDIGTVTGTAATTTITTFYKNIQQ